MKVMPARRILQLGDPVLRQVSLPVLEPSEARALIEDLAATLAAFRESHGFGRGISAVQIGDLRRVILLEVEGVRYELVNPEFTWKSEASFELWDDCFSFPNLMVWLERSSRVRLRYQKQDAQWQELEAEGALAELIQHEMDHLDGILAVDRARSPQHLATREESLRRGLAPPAQFS